MPTVLGPVTLVQNTPVGLQVGVVPALRITNNTNAALAVLFGPFLLGQVPGNGDVYFTQLDQQETFSDWICITPTYPGSPVGTTCTVTTYGANDLVPPLTLGTVPGLRPARGTGLAYPSNRVIKAETYLNVRDFGAAGNGVIDDTVAIASAIAVAVSRGGGCIYFPAGTYITQTQTLQSNIHLLGDGPVSTTLKLANGTNGDLIQGLNAVANISIYAATGSGSATGVNSWSIRDMSLGGNKANQSGTSYCLRVYGYDFILHNVRISQGLSGGVLVDYNGPGIPGPNSMEAQITNCKIHDCGGICLTWGGPQSSTITNTVIFHAGNEELYIGPHAPGMQFVNCHFWGLAAGNPQVLVEGDQSIFAGCQIEGSDTVQIVLNSNYNNISGCQIYGTDANPSTGIQLGQQAGATPYNASNYQSGGLTTAFATFANRVDAEIAHSSGTHGAIWFNNEFDGSTIVAAIRQPSAGTSYGGTPNPATSVMITSGGVSGQTPMVLLGGTFGGGVFQTTPVLASSGTIQTNGVLVSKVAPAGAVTGVILQAGQYDGQFVAILNQSAFTITMAASGTSHVANGASEVIAANKKTIYTWNASNSLWY